jgi:hypothetical protein
MILEGRPLISEVVLSQGGNAPCAVSDPHGLQGQHGELTRHHPGEGGGARRDHALLHGTRRSVARHSNEVGVQCQTVSIQIG